MRNFRPILLLLCAVLAVGACSRHVEGELLEIEQFVESCPDSALGRLSALDSVSCSRRRPAALRSYLTSLACYKLYREETDNTAISASADYFRTHGDKLRLMKAQFLNGYALYSAGEYREAVIAYTEALHLAEEQGNTLLAGLSCREIGSTFAATYSSEDFLKYILLAREWFVKGGHEKYADWALLQVGSAYAQCGEVAKSQDVYAEVIKIAQEKKDSTLLAEGLCPYAENLANGNNPDEAIRMFEYLRDSLHYSLRATSYAAFADAYAQKGNRRRSNALFVAADSLAGTPQDRYYVNYWKYRAALSLHDNPSAINAIQAVLAYTGGEDYRKLFMSAVTTQRDYFSERAQLVEMEKKLSHQKHYTIMACLGFLLLLLTMFLRDYIRRSHRRREQHHQEKERLVQQIKSMSADHSSNLKKTTQTGMHFFNALTQLNWQSQPHKVVPELQRILEGLVSDDKIKGQLIASLNETRNNLMIRLCEQVPALNSKEILLYCYLASQLDRNTVCSVLGKSPGAVSAQVYRLRQKIEDSSAPDRDEFLEVIA